MNSHFIVTSLLVGMISCAYHKQLLALHHLRVSSDMLHAISGSIASAFSITLFYPLETVRTRAQVDCKKTNGRSSLKILYEVFTKKNESISTLYHGWSSLVVALVCLNFVYFYCFRTSRRWLETYSIECETFSLMGYQHGEKSNHKIVIDLIAGYLAGVAGVLLTGPLWLINTRLKLQCLDLNDKNKSSKNKSNISSTTRKYHGIIHCIYTISKEEGVLTLWNGTVTSIVLALNPAIQLGVYEFLKRQHSIITFISSTLSFTVFNAVPDDTIDDNNIGGHAFEPFVNALLAKFLATIITYPIQVLQTRYRAGTTTLSNTKYYGLIQDLRAIVQQHGIGGLYRGLESKLLQTLLSSGLMFLLYEHLVDFLRRTFSIED